MSYNCISKAKYFMNESEARMMRYIIILFFKDNLLLHLNYSVTCPFLIIFLLIYFFIKFFYFLKANILILIT